MARIICFFEQRESFLYSWICRLEEAIDNEEITKVGQVIQKIRDLDENKEMNTSL
jgi:hypothetical protein